MSSRATEGSAAISCAYVGDCHASAALRLAMTRDPIFREEGIVANRILVIGATGLLGKPVVERLTNAGHTVRVLTRSAEKAREVFGDNAESASQGRSRTVPAAGACGSPVLVAPLVRVLAWTT